MSVIKNSRISGFSALVAAMVIVLAAPSAMAKEHNKSIKPPYALQQIDRNGDGDISNKEWDWAEKNDLDRLTRKDNRSVTRKEYQAYLNRYVEYRDTRGHRDHKELFLKTRGHR